MQCVEILKGAYYDSVTLMLVAKELNGIEGVESASLNMGTEANLKIMEAGGFDLSGIEATPNDLLIGAKGAENVLKDALGKAREYLANPPWRKAETASDYRPKSLDGAKADLSDANLAVISVAGRYAGDLAMDCLDRRLNVMLFSDNVPLDKEIELKKAALEKGLLVMGPDCGTVIVRGRALGMANSCPVGPVGIVAAAGTGLQEVHVQLAARGIGTLHGIGTGGRDVKSAVGGMMCFAAMERLLADDEIKVLVVVGKPPAPEVEDGIIERAKKATKPVVLGFIGGAGGSDAPPLYLCRELEETSAVAAALAKGDCTPSAAREALNMEYEGLFVSAKAIGPRKGFLRGLYSGGTLCYEAQLIASRTLGPIWSNSPLSKEMQLADSLQSRGHCIVDYGEDEFTQGRLHPMMDPTLRAARLVEEGDETEVTVVLLDVVLGYGCHADPASALAAAVEQVHRKRGDAVAFVASVCGTDGDPQKAARQREILTAAGVTVCGSNAKAARLAAALIER